MKSDLRREMKCETQCEMEWVMLLVEDA
jgi:hypothetical protein